MSIYQSKEFITRIKG